MKQTSGGRADVRRSTNNSEASILPIRLDVLGESGEPRHGLEFDLLPHESGAGSERDVTSMPTAD